MSDEKQDRYYLALDLGDSEPDWKEVTREQFIRAERAAGFRSKFGDDHPATAGFSSGNTRGRVRYE